MKKHFFNRFYLKNRLFHEGRLVFKEDGSPAEGAADAKPEKPAGTTEARPDGVGAKPEGAPEAKPAGERALDILKALYENEKLQETEPASAPERALEALHNRLKRKDFEKTFIDEALASGNAPELEELAIILLKDPAARIAPSKLNAVAAELETLIKPKGGEKAATARHESTAERAGLKGQIERGQLKEELPPLPELPPGKEELKQKLNDFNKILDSGDEQKALDPIKIAGEREKYQINSDTWDHSSTDGLRKILLDCKRVLGNKKINDSFYTALFATLANAADPTKNRWFAEEGEDYVSWFKEPIKYREQLIALPADANFYGGEQFVRAYEHLDHLKSEVLHSQDVAHVATLAKQEGLDSDPVATKVTDFVRDNMSKFTKAIRERDYATAGMYAVGIWALYKSLKDLTGGKDSKITKYMIYGIGAYAGYNFAKNAGYDVLKMAGFKDKDFEVKGTPFEVMKRFVSEKPEYKDFDYGVAFRMSEVRLKDLHKMLEETNKKGDFFIEPKDFPGIFPDLAKEWPFEKGIGEKGITDTEGMGNKKLSAAQREYLRVGRQIYLTAMAMEEIYNQTLYKDHPNYKNIPYKQAINNPDLKGMSKVRYLLWAAQDYSPEGAQRFFSEKTTEEAQGHINAIFEGKDAAATVEEFIGQGHYSGYLKGFPVVFVRDKDSYRVYLRNDYNGLKNPGTKAVKIPIEGPTRSGMADKAIEAVDKRMEELMAPIKFAGGRVLEKPKYSDGEWKTKVKLPEATEFGLAEQESFGKVKPRPDGKGLVFTVKDTGIKIDIDKTVDKQFVAGLVLVPDIVAQPEFRSLAIFRSARRLTVEDPTPGDGKLDLIIGKSRKKLTLEYDGSKFKTVTSGDEKKLVQDPVFLTELKEVLREDDRLTEVMKSWEKLIKETPESYFIHFFKSVPDWFTMATWNAPARGLDLKDFTGSVPKNYTLGLLEVQRELVLAKLASASADAEKLGEVSTDIDTIFSPALDAFEHQRDRFSSLNTKNYKEGETFSEEAFTDDVFKGLTEVGIVSNDYKNWHRQFMDEIFVRFGMDDLREGRANKARDVMRVFSFYTAPLDDPSIDGANLSLSINPATAAQIKTMNAAIDAIKNPTPAEIAALKLKLGRKPTPAEIAALKVTLGRKPTDAEIAAKSGLAVTDIPELRRLHEEREKATKYRLYSKYAEYVAGQIYIKLNEGEIGKRNIVPEPEAVDFWKIEPFDSWKFNQRGTPYEFIDKRDLMRTSKDYVYFDEYLKMPEAKRDKIPESKIILPRKDCKLSFTRQKDSDLFLKLSGVTGLPAAGDFEALVPTDIEKVFHDRFMEALDELRKKFDIRVDAFADIRKAYRPDFHIEQDSSSTSTNKILDFKIEGGGELAKEVDNIERDLAAISSRTLTRGEQEYAINNRVRQIIENTIVNNDNFDSYFHRHTMPGWFKEKWEDFVTWLFG